MHIEAKGASDRLLATADARWGEFIARQIHSASFEAIVPVANNDDVSKIVVRFSHDQP